MLARTCLELYTLVQIQILMLAAEAQTTLQEEQFRGFCTHQGAVTSLAPCEIVPAGERLC